MRLAPLLALAFAASAFVAPTGIATAFAQEAEPLQEILKPVGVLTFASVDRAREDVDFLFETVGREDMSEVVDGYMEFVNGLEGVDRTEPFGVMLFLKPGFVPIPAPVGYLPVGDLADLQNSLNFGENLTTQEVADNLLEIKGRRGTLYAKIEGEFALISNEQAFLEERLFPDPRTVAVPLAAEYDFAVRALPGNIPPGMKKLFQNLLNQNTQTQMQRRDGEAEAAFRLRQSGARRNLESLQALLDGAEAITIGVDASAERRTIELDLGLESVSGTAWAEELQALQSRSTPFDVLYEETAPMSLVAALTLNRWDREAAVARLKVAGDELGAALSDLRPLEGEDPARLRELEAAREEGRSDYELIDPATRQLVDDMIQPLIVTAENGNLDLFTQIMPGESGGKTILFGMAVAQGDRFSQGVPRVLERLMSKLPADSDLENALTLNVASENGVTWHRLDTDKLAGGGTAEVVENADGESSGKPRLRSGRNDRGEEFFGGTPLIFVGLGRQHVWVVAGADDPLSVGQDAVTAVQTNLGRVGGGPTAPVRGAINVSGWFAESIDDLSPTALRARDAFADASDRLTIRFEPTGDGDARLRLTFGEGFIRFLALSVTDTYDASQL